ncbi:hypothetical protein AEQ27_04495 [Frigoribacterium sp. RIT-PI-h]|nr:hypothetical protein AEQ27_04495 [Frigoribacterium sp. RIT-PI-h]
MASAKAGSPIRMAAAPNPCTRPKTTPATRGTTNPRRPARSRLRVHQVETAKSATASTAMTTPKVCSAADEPNPERSSPNVSNWASCVVA